MTQTISNLLSFETLLKTPKIAPHICIDTKKNIQEIQVQLGDNAFRLGIDVSLYPEAVKGLDLTPKKARKLTKRYYFKTSPVNDISNERDLSLEEASILTQILMVGLKGGHMMIQDAHEGYIREKSHSSNIKIKVQENSAPSVNNYEIPDISATDKKMYHILLRGHFKNFYYSAEKKFNTFILLKSDNKQMIEASSLDPKEFKKILDHIQSIIPSSVQTIFDHFMDKFKEKHIELYQNSPLLPSPSLKDPKIAKSPIVSTKTEAPQQTAVSVAQQQSKKDSIEKHEKINFSISETRAEKNEKQRKIIKEIGSVKDIPFIVETTKKGKRLTGKVRGLMIRILLSDKNPSFLILYPHYLNKNQDEIKSVIVRPLKSLELAFVMNRIGNQLTGMPHLETVLNEMGVAYGNFIKNNKPLVSDGKSVYEAAAHLLYNAAFTRGHQPLNIRGNEQTR